MLCEKYKDFLKWNIYQIYPKSFYDTNGDGIGDIKGIIEKLDYLQDLGINAIWLCPCFKTENKDNGYDISDYCDINEQLGTFEDVKELINEMHSRGMKLIMDLVPNHTSDKHKWFLESKKSKDNPYSDYYYWFDEPQNDWQSTFLGSAWEYCKERQQYYLHSYDVSQPDLNWDNPKVREEICKVIDFWVDLGVDGFRVDVIDQISKDLPNNVCTLGPHIHEYINQMFGREKTKDIFTVGECWATDTIGELCRHCKQERNELSTLFQFDHIGCGRNDNFKSETNELKKFRDILIKWQDLTAQNDVLYCLFTDNHDQPPILSRLGNDIEYRFESATCIAAIVYLLKGVPFIYQSQEYGNISQNYDSINCFNDVETRNKYNKLIGEGIEVSEALKQINFISRDNARRPFCWDNSEYYGFSVSKPWLDLNSNGKCINLENDLKSEKSIFKFYKKLLKLRKEYSAFIDGDFESVSNENDEYFAYYRYNADGKFFVVCNFEKSNQINLPDCNFELVLSNYNNNGGNIYNPYEIRVYKMI